MNPYDLVIVSHEKDFNNIKFIISHAEKNLNPDSYHLILSERKPYEDLDILKNITSKPIFIHKETDVLNVDKSRINHRPNWIYQMLLKIFQNVTKNDNFLIIESDCLILNPINFFEGDKTNIFLCRDQNHDPYFKFNNLLGFGREYNHSFISEFMMYDKKIISEILIKSNCKNVGEFLELIYNNVDENCYPADYELYGNFCYKYHQDKINLKNLSFDFYGRESRIKPYWTDDEINTLVSNTNKDVISFHTWGEN